MARPKKITLQGNGSTTSNSNPYITNWREGDPIISLGFSTSGSTTGFTVQHCFDNTHTTPAASWTWFDHPDLATLTAAADGQYNAPVTAIRLRANASGTDTGTLFIVQSGA